MHRASKCQLQQIPHHNIKIAKSIQFIKILFLRYKTKKLHEYAYINVYNTLSIVSGQIPYGSVCGLQVPKGPHTEKWSRKGGSHSIKIKKTENGPKWNHTMISNEFWYF